MGELPYEASPMGVLFLWSGRIKKLPKDRRRWYNSCICAKRRCYSLKVEGENVDEKVRRF